MHFRLYQDKAKQWRWSLHASNGQQIANSGEGYVKKSDCVHGIELVKGSGNAPTKEDPA